MTRFSFCIMLLAAIPATAQNGIVVDHSANRIHWRASDLAMIGSGSQQLADDFALDAAATIRRVTWWGAYAPDVAPTADQMRMRIYEARPGDGLPGNVVFEQNLVNPSRIATGMVVPWENGTTATSAEYEFSANLAGSASLGAATPYWLEIVQLGEVDTAFGWRGASIDQDGVALINPIYGGDWISVGGYDMAFQLSTVPEPGTLTLIAIAGALAAGTGRLRRR